MHPITASATSRDAIVALPGQDLWQGRMIKRVMTSRDRAARGVEPGRGPLHGLPLARISHTLAGAGSVFAAPRAFRTLPIQPVSAAARKTLSTTMPFVIIPQWYEKCGLEPATGHLSRWRCGMAGRGGLRRFRHELHEQ